MFSFPVFQVSLLHLFSNPNLVFLGLNSSNPKKAKIQNISHKTAILSKTTDKKIKALQVSKQYINVTEKLDLLLHGHKNNVRNGINAGYQMGLYLRAVETVHIDISTLLTLNSKAKTAHFVQSCPGSVFTNQGLLPIATVTKCNKK